MSQVPRRTRVRQLAESVWPGRTVNGYANLIAARLRKLGDEGGTGMLPVTGHGDGAIYFRGGQVVYAESGRTPLPVPSATGLAALGLAEVPGFPAGQQPAGTGGGPGQPAGQDRPGHGELVAARSVARLAGTLAVTEAVIDAVTELLANDSRYAKFRPADDRPPVPVRPIPVETLLAEVQRRHEVLRQLAPVITPDSAIARQPSLDSPALQVTQAQWALLVRAGQGSTPRGLAMHLGRSVFGTTIEVYRLVELGLLTARGEPRGPGEAPGPAEHPGAGQPEQPGQRQGPGLAMSFIRAISGERGSDG